ncbi:hypothetical protein B7494_g934 [Chlorociboria aeruginascens]|nr:hypothetical protein B7494_g934 [Chlorociboria aeruginascens]
MTTERAASGSSPSCLVGKPFVSDLGREYMRTAMIKRSIGAPIYLAKWQDQTFVLKTVPRNIYKNLQSVNLAFAGSSRVRLHIDVNKKDRTFVYEYLRGSFKDFAATLDNSPASIAAKRKVMWQTALALREMHEDHNRMHSALEPGNILLNWEDGPTGPHIGKVILSNLDTSIYMQWAWGVDVTCASWYKRGNIGSVEWRAPEMQLVAELGKFSDMFSYALVYLWAVTNKMPLGDNIHKMAAAADSPPELLALKATAERFGPVVKDFLGNSWDWHGSLRKLEPEVWETLNLKFYEDQRFEYWDFKDCPYMVPAVKKMLSQLLKFDPNLRMPIRRVLKDHSWGRDFEDNWEVEDRRNLEGDREVKEVEDDRKVDDREVEEVDDREVEDVDDREVEDVDDREVEDVDDREVEEVEDDRKVDDREVISTH